MITQMRTKQKLYNLSLSHTWWCANAYHTEHVTHSFYYQWFTQMCTKQKLYSLYLYSLTVTHMASDAQMRTTHNISHIPFLWLLIYANAYQTKALYSLTVTHMMMRKCVPHTTYHTFLLWLMIYANAHQTKALLFLFSNSHTHDVIHANAYHTQNITHTVYQDYAVCHTHIRI